MAGTAIVSVGSKLTGRAIAKSAAKFTASALATGGVLYGADKVFGSSGDTYVVHTDPVSPDHSEWGSIELGSYSEEFPRPIADRFAYFPTAVGRLKLIVGVAGLSSALSGGIVAVLFAIFQARPIVPLPGPAPIPLPPPDKKRLFGLCSVHHCYFHLDTVGCKACNNTGVNSSFEEVHLDKVSNPDKFRGEEFIPEVIASRYSRRFPLHNWVVEGKKLVCSCGSPAHLLSFEPCTPVYSFEPGSLLYFVEPVETFHVVTSYGYVIGKWSVGETSSTG